MNIPYIVIATLNIAALGLILYRFRLRQMRVESGFETGTCMTIGSREVQEDNFKIEYNGHDLMAILADGMGKQYGGKIAGRIVVETFAGLFQEYNALDNPCYFFYKAFQTANREVLKVMDEGRGQAAATAIMIQENDLYYGLVGNVKLAVYRRGELVPIGMGHTLDVLAKEKFHQGIITREKALSVLEKRRIYNCIGQDGFGNIEFFDTPVKLKKDDVIVLMSDGIFEGMDWKLIEDYLAQKKSCQDVAFDIVEHINRKKEENQDNASIVLIKKK